MAAMRQPLTAHGALNLINSLISSSNLQHSLTEWKEKHKMIGDADDKVGIRYWQNFK
jgi:hypothetical protein